jgi:hypothetical protein
LFFSFPLTAARSCPIQPSCSDPSLLYRRCPSLYRAGDPPSPAVADLRLSRGRDGGGAHQLPRGSGGARRLQCHSSWRGRAARLGEAATARPFRRGCARSAIGDLCSPCVGAAPTWCRCGCTRPTSTRPRPAVPGSSRRHRRSHKCSGVATHEPITGGAVTLPPPPPTPESSSSTPHGSTLDLHPVGAHNVNSCSELLINW